ncbi:DUF2795 domain-containing protein [Streptomyces candidus]|uniref:DUF2795 domain-containing protein n=1 Tax=Streptomyces candidus TaxID=67283 RepID=A0A7X0HEI5_9ACTN|nr:DUF2795 domain-containing protein [Streptomyces candidus]MBB6436149.1 hypothetical protein [Streptomyces candidus]GHH43808.1 hypothetical protein GCM10018773_30560 [Streptomyces candidus]
MAEFSPVDVQKALSGMDYPADRKALVDCARTNKADQALVERLDSLEEDSFDGPNDVSKAVFND